jgi:isochorismate hydrolase
MRITQDNAIAMIIDVQERLFPHIFDQEKLMDHLIRLITGLKVLHIPILLTEQYSKGLGSTIPAIKQLLSGTDPLEKKSFSCCDEAGILSRINQMNREFIILAGIEAHVCVMQTAMDLTSHGFRPVLVENCVSSRKEEDKITAIRRMSMEGIIPATCESILFELCRISGTDQFREISRIVK